MSQGSQAVLNTHRVCVGRKKVHGPQREPFYAERHWCHLLLSPELDSQRCKVSSATGQSLLFLLALIGVQQKDCLNNKLQITSYFAWHFGDRGLTDSFQDTNIILVTIAAKRGTHMYLYSSLPSLPSPKVPIVLHCVCLLDSVMLLLKGKSVDICCVT